VNSRGFSLVELVIYIVVFAIGVAGVMTVTSQSLSRGSDSTLRLRGTQVAQAAMEEILAKKWDDTSPNGGGVTATPTAVALFGPDGGEGAMDRYDDVDDYHGIAGLASSSAAAFNLTAGFTIDVTVSYVSLSGGTFIASGIPSDYKQIDLTVDCTELNESYRIVAVKGNF